MCVCARSHTCVSSWTLEGIMSHYATRFSNSSLTLQSGKLTSTIRNNAYTKRFHTHVKAIFFGMLFISIIKKKSAFQMDLMIESEQRGLHVTLSAVLPPPLRRAPNTMQSGRSCLRSGFWREVQVCKTVEVLKRQICSPESVPPEDCRNKTVNYEWSLLELGV